MRQLILGSVLTAMVATPALANHTFFAMRGDQMFRYQAGSVSQFTMNGTVHSLSSTSQGVIGVSNAQNNPGDPPFNFDAYRLDNGFSGTPTLTTIGESEVHRFPTLTEVNGTMYGIHDEQIFTVDNSFNNTFVANIDPGEATGGSAYDAASDTFYITGPVNNALYTLDLSDGSTSMIGTGVGFDFRNQGGEWWDGEYWAALEDLTNDRFVLGTIDTTTGLFNLEVVLLDTLAGDGGTVGLAIVPAPSTVALIGLGGLVATRRRR